MDIRYYTETDTLYIEFRDVPPSPRLGISTRIRCSTWMMRRKHLRHHGRARVEASGDPMLLLRAGGRLKDAEQRLGDLVSVFPHQFPTRRSRDQTRRFMPLAFARAKGLRRECRSLAARPLIVIPVASWNPQTTREYGNFHAPGIHVSRTIFPIMLHETVSGKAPIRATLQGRGASLVLPNHH